MTDEEQELALWDLEWLLQRGPSVPTLIGAVSDLLGTKDSMTATRSFPGLRLRGGGYEKDWIVGTREVWLDIAVQRLGQDVVTQWLLENEGET